MAGGRWFESVADHLGSAYLRYAFTKGTGQEVAFLVDALHLAPGMRVLDAGCGPGRHAHAFARHGMQVVGVDISQRFCGIARENAGPGSAFVRADVRALPVRRVFDAAVSLCQGGFGLLSGPGGGTDPDVAVLGQLAEALVPGGVLAVTAFSSYFVARNMPQAHLDASSGVHHEVTEIRDEQGVPAQANLWTTCFTPRELRLMAHLAGLEVIAVWSVAPGDYAAREPDLGQPELMLVARRPG